MLAKKLRVGDIAGQIGRCGRRVGVARPRFAVMVPGRRKYPLPSRATMVLAVFALAAALAAWWRRWATVAALRAAHLSRATVAQST